MSKKKCLTIFPTLFQHDYSWYTVLTGHVISKLLIPSEASLATDQEAKKERYQEYTLEKIFKGVGICKKW